MPYKSPQVYHNQSYLYLEILRDLIRDLLVSLCIGVTLTIFRTDENYPVEKDIFKISLNT